MSRRPEGWSPRPCLPRHREWEGPDGYEWSKDHEGDVGRDERSEVGVGHPSGRARKRLDSCPTIVGSCVGATGARTRLN